MIIERRLKLMVRIGAMKPPENTLLDSKWHVEDAVRIMFAVLNAVLLAYFRLKSAGG